MAIALLDINILMVLAWPNHVNHESAHQLTLFLRQFTWVDLRGGLTREAIDKLEWGISGRKAVSLG